jgi:class 3 adenylate cyclase
MVTCPSCGTENPDGSKFCNECGTLLGAPVRAIPEERKVITCLFCDLIGFTASSESADPEDVDQMLSAYAQMARVRIESHGGVVEKLIGDAVVGIFGLPGAVWAEEAGDHAGPDGEREVVDGHGGAVALNQVLGLDHRSMRNGTAKSQ